MVDLMKGFADFFDRLLGAGGDSFAREQLKFILEGKKVVEKETYYLVGQDVVKFKWRAETDEGNGSGVIYGSVVELNGKAMEVEPEKLDFIEQPDGKQLERLFLAALVGLDIEPAKPIVVSPSFAVGHIENVELKQRLEDKR